MELMNLVGRQFGRLTVLEKADSRITKGGNVLSRWLCQCTCGKQKVILTSSLLQEKTKSCGCLLAESSRQKGLANKTHGGYAQGTPWFERVKHQALVNIKDRARHCGYESDLELSDLPELTANCPVLGIRYETGSLLHKDHSPSVDRKNPNLPYLKRYKDNLVFISHRANRIKSNASFQELEQILSYMRGHSKE